VLNAAFAHLADVLETHVGEAVTYRRRGKEDLTVTAVRGRNQPQALAIADGRAELTTVPQDWLVKPAAIDFGAGAVDPQDGDRIIDAAGAVYEVKPRDGEPGARRSDPYGNLLRLRTTREA
jgi:hypothetical protein